MGGEDVEEVAYAWRDLEAPLVRRRLATEECSASGQTENRGKMNPGLTRDSFYPAWARGPPP